jgi:hypothetical protein
MKVSGLIVFKKATEIKKDIGRPRGSRLVPACAGRYSFSDLLYLDGRTLFL